MNLRLLQLGDSALPVGGYSHSWGLESAVDSGAVRDAPSLERWVRLWLRHAAGPCEGVVVASACRAALAGDWPSVLRANELLAASLAPPALRQASRDMGEQLLSLAEPWPWAGPHVTALRRLAEDFGPVAWHHPAVFATLAAGAGAGPEEAVAVYLHQAALGVIGAGVRAVPVGHTHGQQVLARQQPEVESLARELATRDLDEAGSFCPAYEVHCDAQTRLYTRLFRS